MAANLWKASSSERTQLFSDIHAVQYHTSPDRTMTQLVRMALRMRPDRILVGEVRGPEALDLLMVWNTGHEGVIASLHANNAAAALNGSLL
jgi:Flp pilus assembly CpaF family ATPase